MLNASKQISEDVVINFKAAWCGKSQILNPDAFQNFRNCTETHVDHTFLYKINGS